MAKGKFQKRKGFGFMSRQSSKKSRSSEFQAKSSRSGAESVSSPQIFRSPQPSKLGTSPPSIASKGRATIERCPCYHQFHSRPCNAPQVCYQCGQTGYIKKFCPMSNTSALVGQTLGQPRVLALGSRRTVGRPSSSIKSAARISSGT